MPSYWLYCDDGGPVEGPYDLGTLHGRHRAGLRGAVIKEDDGDWQPAGPFLAAHPVPSGPPAKRPEADFPRPKKPALIPESPASRESPVRETPDYMYVSPWGAVAALCGLASVCLLIAALGYDMGVPVDQAERVLVVNLARMHVREMLFQGAFTAFLGCLIAAHARGRQTGK